ncbi:MAG TPA: biotin--[acetyl-CoA-carboxylase] ligase [Bacilli bacterium]
MYKKVYFDTLPSTNTYLKDNYQAYDDKTVIICNNQTSGHGRLSRKWEMEPGKNIAMSILLKPKTKDISRLSLLTSAAVFLSLKEYTKNLQIKWPNDILLNKRKVCGILLESIFREQLEALIIGIGINVNSINFSNEIANKATSLKIELHKDIDIDIIIDDILINFDNLYEKYLQDKHEYLEICRKYSSVIGKDVIINNKNVKVLNILDNGNLLIDNGKFQEELNFGEITLEKSY